MRFEWVAIAGMILHAAVVVAVVSLSGCDTSGEAIEAGPISRRNFEKIRPEMTCKEVVAILGEPTSKGPLGFAGECIWTWQQDGDKRIDVLFKVGGLVASKGGQHAAKYGYNL